MQSIVPNTWRHAFEDMGHGLREAWDKAKTGARRLFGTRSGSRSVAMKDGKSLARSRRGLDRLFWQGGPKVEVGENDEELILRADMPGLSRDDFSVEIDDRFVTLRAEQRSAREEKGHGYYYSEKAFGSFSRTIPLPCEVDGSKAKAKYRRGQLVVELPKTERSKSVRIPIAE